MLLLTGVEGISLDFHSLGTGVCRDNFNRIWAHLWVACARIVAFFLTFLSALDRLGQTGFLSHSFSFAFRGDEHAGTL